MTSKIAEIYVGCYNRSTFRDYFYYITIFFFMSRESGVYN